MSSSSAFPDRLLTTADYTPPERAGPPAAQIMGSLELAPEPLDAHIEVLVDTYKAALTPEWDIVHLPSVTIELVPDGNNLIPVQRGPLVNEHPYWEWLFEPGKAWSSPEEPGLTHVVLPFALQERNQNCTHNGLLRFSISNEGIVSPARYLVGSETCLYLKANLYGSLRTAFKARAVTGAGKTVARHHALARSRLPVKPISALAVDYPGVDPSAFTPPSAEDATVYGVAFNGTHYRGGCQTRFGLYPFCEWLDVPSYSLAKSVFAGLAAMHLERRYPGFLQIEVEALVPECRMTDRRWRGVTLWHLLNMRTGNYDSTGFEADESAAKVADFFLPEAHAEKLRFACETYRRKSPPGEVFVYHTFDTYLLGTAMNAFLRNMNAGADVFRDSLVGEVLGPSLQLSPVAATSRRSYDAAAQPFTGYGLTWNPDDIARIGLWLYKEAAGESNFGSSTEFRFAMFRDSSSPIRLSGSHGEAYRNGFWGYDIAPRVDCDHPVWVPFMAGYGGNIVALIPNGAVYYYFSDSNRFRWAQAAAETHKLKSICENNENIQ